ncbi:hypothetical protein [Streptomyces sp. NPDC017202]|uniref:hypothetical protein n=1 Tax=Streptomyces sp. NPDC017202 TaxID=3364981 RepID=UPI00379D11AA
MATLSVAAAVDVPWLRGSGEVLLWAAVAAWPAVAADGRAVAAGTVADGRAVTAGTVAGGRAVTAGTVADGRSGRA